MLDPENTTLVPKLHIAGIRVLRKIIEVGSKELLGIDSDNEDDEESEDEKDLDYSEYINFLSSKGCVEFLCDYISRCEDHTVLDECILLANALLQGGNQQSQERFLEYMKADEKNNLLLKIKAMLIRKFEICKKLIIDSESKIKQNIELSDGESDDDLGQIEDVSIIEEEILESTNGDVEDVDEDDIDISSEDLESSIINCNRVLRFLQLL